MPRKKTEKRLGEISERKAREERIHRSEIKSKIKQMNILAKDYYSSGDIAKANKFSQQIIRLGASIKLDPSLLEEDNILKRMAQRVTNNYNTIKLKRLFSRFKRIYDELIDSKKIEEAHKLIMELKKDYKEEMENASFPYIKALFLKDEQIWAEFKSL
jgi:hypothetical protein